MKLFQKLINLLKKSGINANKIELSANDILNLLAGNEINLGSRSITINSNNFKVDKNGKIICNDITVTGGKFNISAGIGEVIFKIYSGGNFIEIRPASIILEDEQGGVFDASGGHLSIADNSGETKMYSGAMNLWRDGNHSYVGADKIETPYLTQTSLENSKKNFEKLEKALEILKQVDIYKYNLKNEKDGTKKHIGFVIGDKYKYSKELTSEENNGVDIYSLASCCLAGIKEQQEQIEILQEEVKRLKEVK